MVSPGDCVDATNQRAGSLRGCVRDAHGSPVTDQRIFLRGKEGALLPLALDEGGAFAVPRIVAGSWALETRPVRHSIRGIDVRAGEVSEARVVLDVGDCVVAGVLADAWGAPVAGAVLSLSWSHESDGIHSYAHRSAGTGPDGGYRFDGLGAGAHELRVRAPGHASWREVVRVAGEEWVEIRLSRTLSVARPGRSW